MRKYVLATTLAVAAVAACTSRATEDTSADIDTLLDRAVAERRVPLVVAMVADANGVVYEHAAGAARDAIFAIASMTKPVTSVAAMQLVEAGRVNLDAPAATYLPELSKAVVLDGEQTRPPKSPITVRHLMTHTAGFGYEFMNRQLFELVSAKKIPSLMSGGDAFLQAPLLFDPGTRWEYGIGTDWLGRLVERVSGQSLESYFRQKIFDPLGMQDTFYRVPPDKQARGVAMFQRGEDGQLTAQPGRPAAGDEDFFGGSGLHSTASDYLTFVRALMAGGRLGESRILSEESVATLGRNQIGELTIRPVDSMMPGFVTDRAELPGGLDKFGLGFALNSGTAGTHRGAATLTWAGVYNTFFWIDREKQVGAVLMTQMLPYMESGPKTLLDEFDRAVYAWRTRASN